MSPTNSKYDQFFSKSMEEPAIAKAFFAQHLPAPIKAELDVATLRRVDRTNTDEKLKQRHRDMIYKAQLAQKDTLFACVEHQSKEDLTMPVRFLAYVRPASRDFVMDKFHFP